VKIRPFFLYWAAAASSIARAAAPPVSFGAPLGYLTGNPYLVVAGDFNSDGRADLVVGHTGQKVSILLGNGHGGFRRENSAAVPNSPTALVVGDFNGDGRLDAAVTSFATAFAPGHVSILLGNGDGALRPGWKSSRLAGCIMALRQSGCEQAAGRLGISSLKT
jgi:hypothetical protein